MTEYWAKKQLIDSLVEIDRVRSKSSKDRQEVQSVKIRFWSLPESTEIGSRRGDTAVVSQLTGDQLLPTHTFLLSILD